MTTDGLLELASVDPERALELARGQLSVTAPTEHGQRAKLLRAVGAAQRDLGALQDARLTLDEAVRVAAASGSPELVAAMQSSLAFVLARLGDLDRAIELFEVAEPATSGLERARLANHYGTALYWRGDLARSVEVLRRASDLFAGHDQTAAAKARVNLGAVLAQVARYQEAERELQLVVADEATIGGGVVAAAYHNLGFLSMLQADIPAALRHLADAESRHAAAGTTAHLPRLWVDHARALSLGGLYEDAAALVENALAVFDRQGHRVEAASSLLTLAALRLALGDAAASAAAAGEAARQLADQGRPAWVALARAERLEAESRVAPQSATPQLAGELLATAVELATFGWSQDATRCRLVAAWLAASSGAGDVTDRELRKASARGRPADRILVAHVDALAALNRGDRGAARRAVSRGLRVATTAQAELGSIETRAHAAAHGHELVEFGARLAIADRQPRELLARIEATRVMAARLPQVRPPSDAEVATLLAELRQLDVKVADPATSVDDRQELESRRLGIERRVRRRSRTLRGDGAAVDLNGEIAGALELLGDRQLVAHAALDGCLYAVTATGGEVGLHDLGSLDKTGELVDGVAFALNRLNRAQGSEASRLAAAELLFGLADELAELLLPPVVAEGFDPVVVVPTAVLHDVPWCLLPPLGGRAVTVNASLTGWAGAERRRRDRARRSDGVTVGFIAGPGLDYAVLEARELASYYDGAVVLAGREATGERCLELFGAVDLAHVACHGSFRRDNPLFSAIHVADGPLNVYDFERLDRLPDTVVLSACSIAGAKALQGGSLLGLGTALTTLGASTVIAPLTPISDAASVTVMQRLHQGLVAGMAPAEALAAAVLTHDATDPTAAAFVALGA